MKYRLKRVNEVIKRALSEIISRELTFRAALVTVQAVDTSPDLRSAHVFVSAIGEKSEARAAIEKLENHRVELQYMLSRRVILKYTPHLYFKLDESVARGIRVMELLEEIDRIPTAAEDEMEAQEKPAFPASQEKNVTKEDENRGV